MSARTDEIMEAYSHQELLSVQLNPRLRQPIDKLLQIDPHALASQYALVIRAARAMVERGLLDYARWQQLCADASDRLERRDVQERALGLLRPKSK